MRVTPPLVQADGWKSRVQYYTPSKVHCPDIIKAFIGDTLFAVEDDQRWNESVRPCHLKFLIRPSFLSGISNTTGEVLIDQIVDPNEIHLEPKQHEIAIQQKRRVDEYNNNQHADTTKSDNDVHDTETCIQSIEQLIQSLPASEKCNHIVSGDTRVHVLTLGWFIERAIVHNLRKFYELYPATVFRFREKLYSDFADGDKSVAISDIIERFLEHEQKLQAKQNALDNRRESEIYSASDTSDSIDSQDVNQKLDIDGCMQATGFCEIVKKS